MPRILCITSDLAGILNSTVELARRLARDGHQLTVASHAEARGTVQGSGLDFEPLERSRYPEFVATDRRHRLVTRLRRLRERQRQALDTLAIDGLLQAVRRIAPELILIDGELHEQVIALSGGHPPLALLNTFVSIWRRPGLPPPNRGVAPGVGWRGRRLGMWLLWQELWLKKQTRATRLRLRRVGCDRLSLLRLLAAEHGFDFRRETDDRQWLRPFAYRRLPVLSLHALEFEFPHRPPPHVTYVGPLVLRARGNDATEDDRAQLLQVYESCRNAGQRLIYATFGSFFTSDHGFLRRLVAAVAERSDWQLLISLGGQLDPEELGELPNRVRAFRWLPQLEVLQHADLVITHGGINTLDECVLAGVPMLIYCGFETDMAGNTARVVYHGLGLAGGRRDDPQQIRQRIDRLLSEPGFRDNVRRMRSRYRAYADSRVAEQAVAQLLATGARTTP